MPSSGFNEQDIAIPSLLLLTVFLTHEERSERREYTEQGFNADDGFNAAQALEDQNRVHQVHGKHPKWTGRQSSESSNPDFFTISLSQRPLSHMLSPVPCLQSLLQPLKSCCVNEWVRYICVIHDAIDSVLADDPALFQKALPL